MRLTPLVISLLALSAAGCGDAVDSGLGGVQPSDPVAQIRLVNAASGTSDVEVLLSGSATPLATLSFRGFTAACASVPAGTRQTLTFRSAGTALATVDTTFGQNERWSVFLTAAGTTRRAVAASDQHTATAGSNALRFVNATSASGDVYVTLSGASPSLTTQVISNFGPTAMGNSQLPYYARSAEHTQVRLFPPGVTTGTPRAEIMLADLPSSRLATVVFTDAGTPAGPTAFLVFPCAASVIGGPA